MISPDSKSQTINVLTQNVLLDYGRTKKGLILPQDKRINSIAASLAQFPGSLDIVGVQEAQKTEVQHNGETLASRLTDNSGIWLEHNQKQSDTSRKGGRANEYIGLFGGRVGDAEAVDLGDNRGALVANIGNVAFATFHLRAGATLQQRKNRYDQSRRLYQAIEQYDAAVLFGDFNESSGRASKGKRFLLKQGFRSVFTITNQSQPLTYPTDPYKEIMGHQKVFGLDDILVRGERIRVLAAGVLKGIISSDSKIQQDENLSAPLKPSDHEGLWAKLQVSYT